MESKHERDTLSLQLLNRIQQNFKVIGNIFFLVTVGTSRCFFCPVVCLLCCARSVHMMLIYRKRSRIRLTQFHQDHQRTATGPKLCPPLFSRHAPGTDNRPLLEELNAYGRKSFGRTAEGQSDRCFKREVARVQLVGVSLTEVSRLTSRDTLFYLIILGSVCTIVLQGA